MLVGDEAGRKISMRRKILRVTSNSENTQVTLVSTRSSSGVCPRQLFALVSLSPHFFLWCLLSATFLLSFCSHHTFCSCFAITTLFALVFALTNLLLTFFHSHSFALGDLAFRTIFALFSFPYRSAGPAPKRNGLLQFVTVSVVVANFRFLPERPYSRLADEFVTLWYERAAPSRYGGEHTGGPAPLRQ